MVTASNLTRGIHLLASVPEIPGNPPGAVNTTQQIRP